MNAMPRVDLLCRRCAKWCASMDCAKKSLGQNFLFDLNLTGRIARAAGPLEESTIFESARARAVSPAR